MELVKCIKHKKGFTVGKMYKVVMPMFEFSKKTGDFIESGVKVLDDEGLYGDLYIGYFEKMPEFKLIK